MTDRILVVEDISLIRELLQDILRSAGYDVVDTGDPDRVLEIARLYHPNLFVIDIMLPRRSGIEVAELLRANGFDHIPMIGMSASSTMRDLAAHTSLFQVVIRKPFDIDRLLHEIDRLIQVRRPARNSSPRPR